MARKITKAAARPKEDLTNRLIGVFNHLISQGVLRPGTKIPPERNSRPVSA